MYIYISRVGHAFMGTHCCWRPSLFGYPRKQLGIYCDAPTNKMFTQASMQQMLYMLTLTVVCMHFCKFPLCVSGPPAPSHWNTHISKNMRGAYTTQPRQEPGILHAPEPGNTAISTLQSHPPTAHSKGEGRTAFTTAH
jgi:hypothetical protein